MTASADAAKLSDDAELGAVHAANVMYVDKKRAEMALERAQDDLRRAHQQIEAQRLEITTLHGRQTALHLGGAEATHRGVSWDINDVRRFTAVPKSGPAFTGDVLREMLDQALVAVNRRMTDALAEAAKARQEAERAEAEGEENLETAFKKCGDLTALAEHAVRQATLGVLNRSSRAMHKMRKALKKLEAEATDAQKTHASDMRSLASRLMAQRDSLADLLAEELRSTELEGRHSIKGLQAELQTRVAQLRQRDDEVAELRANLARTQDELKEERKARFYDHRANASAVRVLLKELSLVDSEELNVPHAPTPLPLLPRPCRRRPLRRHCVARAATTVTAIATIIATTAAATPRPRPHRRATRCAWHACPCHPTTPVRLPALQDAVKQRHTWTRLLTAELRQEERRREAETRELLRRLDAAAAHAADLTENYERRLKAMRTDTKRTLETMNARIKALHTEKAELEVDARQQMMQMEVERDKERTYMKSKTEKLGAKVLALKANTSRGRVRSAASAPPEHARTLLTRLRKSVLGHWVRCICSARCVSASSSSRSSRVLVCMTARMILRGRRCSTGTR